MTDWQSIVDEHGKLVWRICYRLLGNDADASDCFQEVFISAMKTAKKERVRSFPALLTRLSTLKSIDRLRQRHQRSKWQVSTHVLPDVECCGPGPVQQAESDELAENLRISLARLPSNEAEVFYLNCFEGLSYRQIAKQLGIKRNAVGVNLHRARQKLRQMLQAIIDEPEKRSNNER